MLNRLQRRRAFLGSSRPFSDLIPWLIRLGPRHVLLKDGAVASVMEFQGLDVESLTPDQFDMETARLEHAFKLAGESSSFWWLVDRRPDGGYPLPRKAPGPAGVIDDLYRAHWQLRGGYRNHHHLCFLTRPRSRQDHFWERVALETSLGHSLPSALGQVIRAAFSVRSSWQLSTFEAIELIREHDRKMSDFLGTLPAWGWQTLEGDRLLGFLHDRLGPGDSVRLQVPETVYLDDALADRSIEVQGHQLHWPGLEAVWASVVTLKAWPRQDADTSDPFTLPGMFDTLLKIDGSLTVSLAFQPVSQQDAEAWIGKVRNHHRALEKSWRAYLRETFTRNTLPPDREQHVRASREASRALERVGEGQFGYLNLTVICYGESARGADALAEKVRSVIHALGFMAFSERLHALSAWAGTLPGQWAEPLRWYFVTGGNAADLALAGTLPEGSATNPHLEAQSGSPAPALAAFVTRRRTPFFFHFHHGQNGHTLVIGPTRSGKSVFNNFLMAHWLGLPDSRIFLFDKDWSAEIPATLLGGRYADLAQADQPEPLNPLLELEDPDSRVWLHGWLATLLESEGHSLDAEDHLFLGQALDALGELPAGEWHLLSLINLLPRGRLVTALEPWVGNGPFGHYFDHAREDRSSNRIVGYEIGRLLAQPAIARPMLDYLFHRIFRSLDGRPTLIYVEEAWFVLSDPYFAKKIEEWVRTLAKKNALLLFATQSIEEIARAQGSGALLDNIPTRILLPNAQIRAQGDSYARLLGLDDRQIALIESATPGRDYYLVRPGFSRLFECSFPPALLAYLRSDARARSMFSALRKTGTADWQSRYLELATHA